MKWTFHFFLLKTKQAPLPSKTGTPFQHRKRIPLTTVRTSSAVGQLN